MSELGDRIVAARGKMSREHLARRVNKSLSAVRRWEVGESEPGYADLRLIADVTGTSYDWLRTGEGAMQTTAKQVQTSQGTLPSLRDVKAGRSVPQRTTAATDTHGEGEFTLIIHVQGGLTLRAPVAIVGPVEIAGEMHIDAIDAELDVSKSIVSETDA